jgi:hypothetical protein
MIMEAAFLHEVLCEASKAEDLALGCSWTTNAMFWASSTASRLHIQRPQSDDLLPSNLGRKRLNSVISQRQVTLYCSRQANWKVNKLVRVRELCN